MIERIRTYSELCLLPTFRERYEYLKLQGIVGEETFGFEMRSSPETKAVISESLVERYLTVSSFIT